MKNMKKYLFFIRGYNDWDNIAPIIYYLAQNSESKICICFYKTDLRYTNLFKYLERNVGKNLQVFYWSQKKLTTITNLTTRIINKFSHILKLGKILKPNKNLPKEELRRWFEIMKLKEYGRIVVVFDRTLDSILEQVQDQLRDLNYIFVSCPHGPMTNINRMMYSHQIKRVEHFNSLRVEKKAELLKYFQYYKYLIFTDHVELDFNEKYCIPHQKTLFDKSRIIVLGSIRYCKEWLNHVEIFTPKIVKKNTGKIKVVFFMKKFAHNVFKEEVYRTLDVFASFPDIDFYIKPHTRGMQFSSKTNAPNIHIVNDSESSSLINMADVIFFFGGTGIILESLAREKLTVCIDYLDSNINAFEYFNACHNLRCRDDLCFFLDSLIAGKTNKVSGEKLLKEIVYARDYSIPVPERYINFFKNL